ncbi:phosphopantetheine-binding protein [Variovorax sp. M-6]|uniref:phosphopantetheine-binding protein n=1 Tax=Variovorax sp. M-6 TaxID=3233041 RepID=UPI003F94DC6C
MTSHTVDTIAKILVTHFRVDAAKIAPDAELLDLGLDSLDIMDFVFSVEDAFGLRIPDEEFARRGVNNTLQELGELIEQLAIASRDAPADIA